MQSKQHWQKDIGQRYGPEFLKMKDKVYNVRPWPNLSFPECHKLEDAAEALTKKDKKKTVEDNAATKTYPMPL